MDEKDFEINKDKFAERLKELMGESSILKFSKEIGIPERSLNNWIRKKSTPRLEFLVIIATKMGCTIDYLAGLEDEFGNKLN